jgi:tetratricopeptide (TPR) repeat protein
VNPIEQSLTVARAHHQAGRFHQAEVLYRQILAAEPACAEAWRLLGLIAQEAKHSDTALQYLRHAVSLRPDNAACRQSLGVVLGACGHWEEALDCFREAIRLAPEYAEAHNNLGAALNALDRPADAVAAFREAVRLRPDLADAVRNLNETLARLDRQTGSLPPRQTADVSLCLIVKNEADNLANCLRPVLDLVREVIVVDTGSTDGTAELAARLGARVFSFAWVDSFAAARNESLRHAAGRWIFWLDGDDAVDEINRERLRRVFTGLGDENAAYFMTLSNPPGPDDDTPSSAESVRLFRNNPRIRWQYRVHEQILPAIRRAGGDVRRTDVVIRHTGYLDPTVQRRKLERNLRLARLEEQEAPDDSWVLFNLGRTLVELGRAAEGLPFLRRGVVCCREGESVARLIRQSLARCCFDLGQLNEALEVCRDGLRRYPRDPLLLSEECQVRRAQGDLTGAEACLRLLLEGGGGDHLGGGPVGLGGHLTRHKLAVLCLEQERFTEAEELWRQVLAEQPDYALGWLGLGELYLRQARWTDLERVAERLMPRRTPQAVLLRARACLARGEGEAARRTLQDGLAQTPASTALWRLLARVLHDQGKREEAAEALRKLLELAPEDAQARQALETLTGRS